MPTREDVLFGGALLKRRWLGQRALHQAMRDLERLDKTGRARALGEVLIESERIDRDQADEVQQELSLLLLRCAACGSEAYLTAHSLSRPDAPCPTCRAAVRLPPPESTVSVPTIPQKRPPRAAPPGKPALLETTAVVHVPRRAEQPPSNRRLIVLGVALLLALAAAALAVYAMVRGPAPPQTPSGPAIEASPY